MNRARFLLDLRSSQAEATWERGLRRWVRGLADELTRRDPPALDLPRGTAAMIPPGMSWEIAAPATDAEVSVQSIRPEVALTKDVTAAASTTSEAIPASASPHVHPAGR